MKKLFTLFLSTALFISSYSQDTAAIAYQFNNAPAQVPVADSTSAGGDPSPYKKISLKVDAPIIAAGIGLSYYGTTLIKNKRNFTAAEIATKTRDKVPFFDRGNAGYYSEKADKDSYIPFQYSFALPVIFVLANKNERHHAFQVLSLYVETMAVTGTLFTMSTGLVYRSRPYVYGNKASLSLKMENDSHRSFYAGHTAATAAATFFTAQAFADFNPNSKLKPYVWGLAATVPAVVGYLRYKAGMHFLSDNLLGYALGAAAGIYIPKLHKIKKLKNLSFVPQAGKSSKGISFVYKL